MNHWDPNSRLGNMQLMALAYWLVHEETRLEEVKRVITKEEKEILYIRAQLMSSKSVMRNHSLISNDVVLEPKYIKTQDQAILHFDDTSRFLEEVIF